MTNKIVFAQVEASKGIVCRKTTKFTLLEALNQVDKEKENYTVYIFHKP